jgi:hypothetical protein
VLAQASAPVSLDHDMAMSATYAHDKYNDMVRGLATARAPQACATTVSWRSDGSVMMTGDAMQTTYVVQRLGWHSATPRRPLLSRLFAPPVTAFGSCLEPNQCYSGED